MAFMEPQMTGLAPWIRVDGPMGGDHIPADVPFTTAQWPKIREQIELADDLDDIEPDVIDEILKYTENRELWEVDVVDGYGVRLSAPGYMDATDWEVFRSKSAAEKRLQELEDEIAEEEGDDEDG